MIDFDCPTFRQWLDEGRVADPPVGDAACAAEDAAARLHAATCPACAGLLAAEEAVARLLQVPRAPGAAQAPAPAPAVSPGFADRVMLRVAATPQDRADHVVIAGTAALFGGSDAMPWWVRAAAQPASVLALALAGVGVLFAPQLAAVGREIPAWSAGALAALAGQPAPWALLRSAGFPGGPDLGLALTWSLLPIVAIATPGLYRLGLRLAAPSSARAARA